MNKGKLVVLCGKSSGGKDTMLSTLVDLYDYKRCISHTSRPMRQGEVNGREYYFESREDFKWMIEKGHFIEFRTYNTLVNDKEDTWYYGMAKNSIDLNKGNHVIVLDVQGTKEIIEYFGKENVLVYYVRTSDRLRRRRCKKRGDYNKSEFKRRFKADKIDFSKDKLAEIGAITLKNNSYRQFDKSIAKIITEVK